MRLKFWHKVLTVAVLTKRPLERLARYAAGKMWDAA